MVNIHPGDQVKCELLRFLRASPESFVSGQELSQRLGISRTGIWKHIQALRRQGYVIESSPRHGHRLLTCPDLLLPLEVRQGLNTEVLGRTIHYYPRLDSTQDVAFHLAQSGAPEGTLVLAEQQTKARGRLGRPYCSPPGGLWFSFILRPPLRPQLAPLLSLMASVAVAEAIKDETPLPVTLKWPNDVMLQDKKVAGILAEMVAETDCLHFVVCGIGINVNISRESFPEELSLTATSLKIELGREVSRLEFLRRVLRGLDRYYGLLLRQGSGVILEAWQRLPNMLGKKVRVVTPGETLIGEARELDSEGALLLQGAEGSLRRIVAGDVHLLRDEETLESIPC